MLQKQNDREHTFQSCRVESVLRKLDKIAMEKTLPIALRDWMLTPYGASEKHQHFLVHLLVVSLQVLPLT